MFIISLLLAMSARDQVHVLAFSETKDAAVFVDYSTVPKGGRMVEYRVFADGKLSADYTITNTLITKEKISVQACADAATALLKAAQAAEIKSLTVNTKACAKDRDRVVLVTKATSEAVADQTLKGNGPKWSKGDLILTWQDNAIMYARGAEHSKLPPSVPVLKPLEIAVSPNGNVLTMIELQDGLRFYHAVYQRNGASWTLAFPQ